MSDSDSENFYVDNALARLESICSNFDYSFEIKYVKWQKKWEAKIFKNGHVYGFCQSLTLISLFYQLVEAFEIDIKNDNP